VYGPFFFVRSSVIGTSYLDMIQEWLIAQVEDDSNDFIYQQGGAPPYYHHLVRFYLYQHLSQLCNAVLLLWPPRSPHLTPCLFSTAHILKTLFLPPLSQDLPELPSEKLIVTCCSGYGRNGLSVSQRANTYSTYEVCKKFLEILFPSVGRMMQSFPSLQPTDFTNVLWITLYT
jgi:hypothetical protein